MWLFHDSKYGFIELRRIAYVCSGVVLALGVGGMAINLLRTGKMLNEGVDFTGGVLVQVRFAEATSDSELRAALGGVDAPPITRFGGENEFVVRAPIDEDVDIDEVAAGIGAQVGAAFGDDSFEIVRREAVGPKIGEELRGQAAMAVLFSFALTLLYIAIRFELRFGVAAIIATAHDILITIGLLALFQVEIALPTVAALLTILGYSLNDTIVVFDRIRENLNARGGRREDPYRLVNRSINETLPRTVLTSGTTLAVLLSLLVLGGAVLRPFTMVLILGVLIGTYSSIFIASPALLEIQRRYGIADPRAKERKRAERRAAAV
ncbi:MAG: protein translocase subunit SecF [Gemmatimonadetes bacterium]|nr:protein translocase subunit SecF [Gemmatimonadota bacterium]